MTSNAVSTSGRAGQLVRVLSSQGVEMTGFHAAAAPDAPLLLCLHGLSGSLDTSFVFDFLAHADMAECHILSVACSGHGNISMARAGDPLAYRLGGSAFEFFEDCVADLAAWMDYAAAHTSGPIILLGHSLGASKVAHYLAQSADARVSGLVLASAPDLKGAFVALHGQPRFEAFMAEAREKVAQGRGRSLMGEACVIGLLRQRVSAQTLLDRFEDGSAADTFDFYERNAAMAFRALNAVTVPVLATYGRRGEIVGPGGVTAALDLLRRHAGRAASFDGVVVSGNHWYLGAEREVAEHLMGWLRATGLAPAVQGRTGMTSGIRALSQAYASGATDPVAVLEDSVTAIQGNGAAHTVFVGLTLARARLAAQASAARWRAGQSLGPLDGIPMVWKDVFDVAGTVTGCGSATRIAVSPASVDAALVRRLESLGAVSVGKTTMSEFAYSGLGINPYSGTPLNPCSRDVPRIPGGSSSGSAVAVARGWVPCGIGSDTSGSIRVPAAFQGLVGFKPSHGRYPTRGMFPLAPTLDVAGPLVRDVRDAALLDQVLTGQQAAEPSDLRGWRIVVPRGQALALSSPAVAQVFDATLDRLQAAGAEIVERAFRPFEETRQIFNRYGTLVAVESSQVHRALLQSENLARVDPRIARRMQQGAALPAEHAVLIQAARAGLMAQASAQLGGNEVLLYPTVCMTAPALAPLVADDERFAQCNLQVLHNTMLGSYLDMPTVSLPAGLSAEGLPVGLSLSMTAGRDAVLLALSATVQDCLP